MRSATKTLWVVKCYGLGLATFLLTACSASQYAPVQELGYSASQLQAENSVRSTPVSYQVRSGDTLFSIAWRYGWDYKKLARVNGIGSPYTIYVGQVLYFNDKNRSYSSSASVAKKIVKKPVISPTAVIYKSTNKPLSSASVATVNAPKSQIYKGPASVKWSWPIRGKLVERFSNNGSTFHGIELSSTLGKSVKAASSGIIVYAGSGIQGYGKLVVIKHNDTFLSAYAYNSRILVAEGAKVSAGQIIAEVGKGPQLDPRLHFEIRKNGKPVNPLWYLPKL